MCEWVGWWYWGLTTGFDITAMCIMYVNSKTLKTFNYLLAKDLQLYSSKDWPRRTKDRTWYTGNSLLIRSWMPCDPITVFESLCAFWWVGVRLGSIYLHTVEYATLWGALCTGAFASDTRARSSSWGCGCSRIGHYTSIPIIRPLQWVCSDLLRLLSPSSVLFHVFRLHLRPTFTVTPP